MKALYTFTKKNLIKNKNRTIVSIIGVVLTCVLMFGLGLGFSTIREMMIQEEYLLSGKAHVTYTKLPFSSYQTILNDKDVDKVEYTRELDYDLYEYDDLEYAVQIYDRNGYQLNDFALDSGKYPENENELLVPILFAHKLGKNINDEIPKNEITENEVLKVESFELPESLKEKFNEISEYYDIYLLENNSEKININSSDPIKISIKLNDSKEFVGIYEILDDGKVTSLDYTRDGKNIILKTNHLGKYVVSYKEAKSNNSADNTITKKKENNHYIILMIAGGITFIIGGVAYAFSKK